MTLSDIRWRVALAPAALLIIVLLLTACRPDPPQVVVYTSVDQVFSEPILTQFEEETGIEVLAVYDVEAAKTTGLVNRLIAEKENPQADVFWNGEFAQTIVLRDEGVLAPYTSPNAAGIPLAYKDPEGYWTGFGGRARVILANTDLVPLDRMPDSIQDLLDPAWPGDQLGIAYPLFGTTATQAAALYAHWGPAEGRAYFEALAARDVRVVDGNSVVRDMVADGRLAFGLTDTDDACGAVDRGAPVRIITPDQGPDQMGTLVIPNTVGLVAGGPNPENGKQLIDYLLSDAVAEAMIASGWSHVALGGAATTPGCIEGQSIRGMDIALTEVYRQMQPAQEDMTTVFVQ
ncbi:MAG: extracellular solute-binding protein [Anaerolineae bacterium]|nr:extracellular solute-binding protein [Anaerolineae bacterium]